MISDIILEGLNAPNAPRIISSLIFLESSSENSICLNNFSKSITSSMKLELIQNTDKTGNKSTGFVLKVPYCFDRIILNLENNVSLTNVRCMLRSDRNATSLFQVSSHEIKLPLNDQFSGLIELSVFDNDKNILTFKFYRPPPADNFNKDVSTRSHERHSESIDTHNQETKRSSSGIEKNINPFPIPMPDGPLFREAISIYEQMAPIILRNLQSNIDKMNNLDQKIKGLEHSRNNLMDSLKDFRKGFMPLVSKQDLVYSKFESSNTKSTENDLTYMFLKALKESTSETKIDFSALKSLQNFGASKRNFEEESKRYYDWLSKLMSSGKSKDEKLLTKMKNFTIVQMEYFNYLYDTVTPMLLSLVKPNSQLSKDYWKNRPLRDRAIVSISKCKTMDEFSILMKNFSKITPTKNTLLLIHPNSSYKVDSYDSPIKTGLLFVFGGQGKSGWHKQWIVFCNGKLFEYMDWRKGAALRNAPIDISLCNIKLLDSNDTSKNVDIGSRKNCFRVINSKGTEHVFQAFTTADANDWINSLTEKGQMLAFKKDIHNQRSPNDENKDYNRIAQLSNSTTSTLNSPRVRRVSSVSLSLLNIVRMADQSNTVCADCGSTEKVEWISLNLLVVFCINCSSAHRSLGTSVSKVRSLTLDSFADENRVLVYNINNARCNGVYEASMPSNIKAKPDSEYETRLEFITRKYVKREFITLETKKNASRTLIQGMRDDDVSKVLEGIAGGANVNTKFPYSPKADSRASITSLSKLDPNNTIEISFLEYALLHPSILDGEEVFDIAELLTLNGCDAGTQVRSGSLVDEKARKWWQDRIDKMNCATSSTPSKQMSSTPPLTLKNNYTSNSRTSMSGTTRPSILTMGNHGKFGSRSKLKSPKESFNLFKKKMKNLDQ